jgi:hypothetical protein
MFIRSVLSVGDSPLEDHTVKAVAKRELLGAPRGPRKDRGTKKPPQDTEGEALFVGEAIRQKIGAREKVQEKELEDRVFEGAAILFPKKRHCQLSADDRRTVAPPPCDDQRVEGFDTVCAAIAVEQSRRPFGRKEISRELALQLDKERDASVDKSEDLRKTWNAGARNAEKRHLCKLLRRIVRNRALATANAGKGIIVKHDGDPVGRELHVELDPNARLDRKTEGGKGIFGDIPAVMKTSVRIDG